MAELSLWLDNYDDIYSDFDSRHYPKRRISEDFLYELKMELKNKQVPEDTLVLLLPRQKRNVPDEKVIISSLINYFNNQFVLHAITCHRKLNRGFIFLICGMALMIVNAFINYTGQNSFFITSVRILVEPAGWFFLWTSLEFLFYDYRDLKKERNFYKILSEMNISFKSSNPVPDKYHFHA